MMATNATIHKTITITSGRLCFGALHNIYAGASAPPVIGLPSIRSRISGTVTTHPIEFNVPAHNGPWNAYRLVNLQSNITTAWLLTHTSVDPAAEIARILRVSGAPWEEDNGSLFNDEDTEAAGILVINRYDWGYYHKNSWDEIGEGVRESEDDLLTNSNTLGIVDFDHAKDTVTRWREQRPSQREWTDAGGWLYVSQGEYMYGRFGYDESKNAAQSFLFFSGQTVFTRTAFEGTDVALRKEETSQEIFERRLREGYDFSGLKMLRELSKPVEDPRILSVYAQPPPMESCFGPYETKDRILEADDIEALRVYRPDNLPPGLPDFRNGEFVEPWVEPVYDLLNELVLSYLEHKVAPRMANLDVAAALEALFPPPRKGKGSGDSYYSESFEKPDEGLIPGFDYDTVTARIKSFLSRFEKQDVVYHDECVAGICRVVARLAAEVLELAGRQSAGNLRDKILPCDVRLGVYHSDEVLRFLQFSRVFWEGRRA
ncbi:hypothetical protein V8F20_010093 [Naviculisporaceae sp. PSN 640]